MQASPVFDFSKDIRLENERVLLRRLEYGDYGHLAVFARNEPEIWRYSLVPIHGEEDLKTYIDTAVKALEAGKEYPFIVYDKKQQAYAGCTRFYDIQPLNSSMQLGYTWYGRQFQGTGLNRNCKFLLFGYCFDHLGMERLELRADNRNARSIAAMKGVGCTVEGVLRSHIPTQDGGRRDSIILSILKEEWQQSRKQQLLQKL